MSNFADKGGPDKDLPDDGQLDEYLRGESDVSRQYRQLHGADVPADLDRLVLHQAQEAVKARPAKSRTWMRWTAPLALAASAVLVVSIVIESGVREKTYLTAPAYAPAEPPPRQEAVEQMGAVQDKAVAGNARDASVVHVVPMDSPALMDSPAPMYDMLPAPFAPEEPAPAPDQTFAITPDVPPPAAPAPAARLQSAAPIESVEVRAQALERRVDTTPIAMPAPAPVTAQARAREMDGYVEEAVVTGMRQPQQAKRTAGPRNTIAAPAADSASNADEQEDEPRDYSDPEQWLRDIRQLRKANKHEEADREWRRFRYVYPNYEVADTDAARGALR